MSAVRCDRLGNGLRVIRLDRPGWPVLTADMWVATGSANETPDQAGVSHFLEHMMFKGTKRRGAGELDRAVEGVGGYWNAGTSKNFTHYYLTVPAEHRALALDALGDAVLHSLIDPDEVEKERKVIQEEWRRSEDNPQQTLWSRVYESAHPTGSVRWPVLGHMSTIESITRDQLWTYHRARYQPENMTLVLAGPVGDDDVLKEVEEHFVWEDGDVPTFEPSVEETTWASGAVHLIPREVNETHMAVVFPGPSAEDPKAMLAMDLAQYVLGTGRASRLYQRLHEKERLVSTIGAAYPPHHDSGLFAVVATCAAENIRRAREVIIEEVTALASDKPSTEEMKRAKQQLCNHHIYGRETTSGQTASLGYHLTLTGDEEFDFKHNDLVSKITAPAVNKVAKAHLREEEAVTVVVHPKDEPLDWEGATEEIPR